MNTRFEKSVRSSDEWYTPKEVLKALGRFDLDPCAPIRPLWPTAEVMYDRNMDGLSLKWEGRVWLNPPYSKVISSSCGKRKSYGKTRRTRVIISSGT